ncbi:MAG: phage Gp37/Gp68 family protein [Elusimicrobia bacterium]|nr:phage Gp37/Gp68 family protein [Elusimicrobiota bacterium]
MAFESAIEWTESTWNPVTGCTKISPGCKFCYAETFAERWRGIPGHPYEQGFDLKLWPARVRLPLTWKEPRIILVNSMSDLFHEDVPDDFIEQVFETMAAAHWHQFQLLTKRPERFADWSRSRYSQPGPGANGGRRRWPGHVWAGTSVESQDYAWRIDHLLQVPADIRFLSLEPLLGPITLRGLWLEGIQWMIVGGESGHGARPMNPEWARDLRDQCVSARVPFFFKQWGAHDQCGRRMSKKAAGRVLDGKTWEQMPTNSHSTRYSGAAIPVG